MSCSKILPAAVQPRTDDSACLASVFQSVKWVRWLLQSTYPTLNFLSSESFSLEKETHPTMSQDACFHQGDRLPQFTTPDTCLFCLSSSLWVVWSQRHVVSASSLEPGWGWGIRGLWGQWLQEMTQNRPGLASYASQPAPCRSQALGLN